MVSYQQFLLTGDMALLDEAIAQLTERVERARALVRLGINQVHGLRSMAQLKSYAAQREAIGLSRLSLCYAEKGDVDQALSTALEGLQMSCTQQDSTNIATGRYFYG
jgi:hypothetical protein